MTRKPTSRLIIIFFVLVLSAAKSDAREVLDRIVATVNNHVILQSDWTLALSYQAFLEDRSVRDFSDVERKAALDHLIDGELIRQQMSAADLAAVSTEDVKLRVERIRQEKVGNATENAWRAKLAQFRLSEAALASKVRDEIEQMRAVETRLRPGIQVDERTVEVYYNEKFLPQLRQTGAQEIPLERVAPKIKELLAQQRLNEFLISWLHSLRNESTIRTPFGTESSGGGS
jgi:hypothetical protein